MIITTSEPQGTMQDFIYTCASFYTKLLGIAHFPDTNVHIQIVDALALPCGALGMCHAADDSEIEIEIAVLDGAHDWLETMAHELVHVRQELEDWSHFCEVEAYTLEKPLRAALRHYISNPMERVYAEEAL